MRVLASLTLFTTWANKDCWLSLKACGGIRPDTCAPSETIILKGGRGGRGVLHILLSPRNKPFTIARAIASEYGERILNRISTHDFTGVENIVQVISWDLILWKDVSLTPLRTCRCINILPSSPRILIPGVFIADWDRKQLTEIVFFCICAALNPPGFWLVF